MNVLRTALIWESWVQTCYNYTRMMGQSVALTFLPVSKHLLWHYWLHTAVGPYLP